MRLTLTNKPYMKWLQSVSLTTSHNPWPWSALLQCLAFHLFPLLMRPCCLCASHWVPASSPCLCCSCSRLTGPAEMFTCRQVCLNCVCYSGPSSHHWPHLPVLSNTTDVIMFKCMYYFLLLLKQITTHFWLQTKQISSLTVMQAQTPKSASLGQIQGVMLPPETV